MLRKTMILLATAAALTGGLTADAFARGGGGGGHGGGFGGGARMGGGFSGGTHLGGGFGQSHFGGPGRAFGRGFAGQRGGVSRPAWGGPYGYYGYYGDNGYYDPSTAAPDEQPAYPITTYPYAKPPHSGCSTQTYKVPSEAGGEASVNVVRC
jgi:hypothetical protein